MKKDSDYNDLISWDVIAGSPKKGSDSLIGTKTGI